MSRKKEVLWNSVRVAGTGLLTYASYMSGRFDLGTIGLVATAAQSLELGTRLKKRSESGKSRSNLE